MSLSSLSVRRAVTVAMVYIGVIGFGIFNYLRLPKDLFPDLTFPMVVVVTQYTGAGPQDVEQLITRPIESAVASVEGVKELNSTSKYGLSIIMIEFSWGTDMVKAEIDVRKNIDLFAPNLPEESQKPITFAFNPSMQPVLFFLLSGPLGPAEIRRLGEDVVAPRIERIPGVASTITAGGLKREIQVELIPERLRALTVPPELVVQAVRTANLQLPGGAIKQGGQLLSINTQGRFVTVDQIKDVIVAKRPEREIRVKDVALVKDWFQEQNRSIRVNGKPAVMLLVRRQSDANAMIVTEAVLKAVPSIEKVLPRGMKLTVMFNQADIIKLSLGNVVNTGWQAFLFAGLVLFLFLLSVRASLIVALAIPVSLLVTFSAMKFADVTLNMISMSGVALAIGMLVDNAIVVLENIYRHLDMGKDPAAAAVDGSREVSMAITASTLTTLAVFVPILFVPGIAGALFRDMVITICIALAASLAVALSAIPAAASKILHTVHRSQKEGRSRFGLAVHKVRMFFSRAVDGYVWFLRRALEFRKTTLIVAVLLCVGSVVLLARGVGTDFLAKTDRGFIDLEMTTDTSSNLESTDALSRGLERIVAKHVPEAIMYSTDVGSGEGIGAVFGKGEYGGRLRIKLPRMSKRKRHQLEIEADLRKRFKEVPGVEVRPQQFSLTGSGGDIEVHVFIDDLVRARNLGEELKTKLERIKGLEDVNHTLEEATPELKVILDRNRLAQLGTNPGMITAAISTYFMGSIAGVFQEKGDEYDIRVRAPESIRRDVERLKNVPVFVGAGAQMPLATVANVVDTLGPSQVLRKDQRRVVKVVGTVSDRPLGEVLKDVEKTLNGMAWPADAIWTIGGSAKDMKESFFYLVFAFAAAVLLVYMVMASQFESLLEPFVILFSVPMSIIGVALGLYLTGTNLTVTAAIGIVMLAGVVVNNAIVLIDYLKQRWDGKWDTLIDSAVEAGRTRLRPILMTTLTTILAMLPLARGVGEGAETWAPMARAVIGGLTTSTLLTLVVVPAWYVIIAGTVARFRERREARKAAHAGG